MIIFLPIGIVLAMGGVAFVGGYITGFGKATSADRAIRTAMEGISPPVEELLFFHDPESMVNGERNIYLASMVDAAGQTVATLDLDRKQMREIRDGITMVLRVGNHQHDYPGSAA